MDDVLAAKDGDFGKPENSGPDVPWWDYKKENGTPFTTTELPNLLSPRQWDALKSLNRPTTTRILDAQLARTSRQKPFIIVPTSDFKKDGYVKVLQRIAAIIGVVDHATDLVVKEEV
jgi:hypothetical protein